MRAVRMLSAAGLAVACVTCAEQPLVRGAGYARIPLAPSFAVAPQGGPVIDVYKIRGILRAANDSSVAEGIVEGDSAILEFQAVVVHGDSTAYTLFVEARDHADVLVFSGDTSLHIKPGDNAPAAPELVYAAPDTTAATIDIAVNSTAIPALALDWAGAAGPSSSCLSKLAAPDTTKVTQKKLSILGKTATNQSVPGVVRVGWTSRDTTAFTVDTAGLVKSKCSNKSAYLVARTFQNKADSIVVTVTAPAFSLTMTPDSTNLARGDTVRMNAQVVDETGFSATASTVGWSSSDTNRAKVNASGLVTGVTNGRVLITASSGGRTTVGVVQVVRPQASKVIALPVVSLEDSLGLGQTRTYFAKAFDAANKIIPEASGFTWTSLTPTVASVNPATGTATASAGTIGTTNLVVSLDGKADTLLLRVVTAMPPGIIKGRFTNASTGAALSGASLVSGINNTTTAGDGSFTLGGLQAGDSVIVSAGGFATAIAYNIPAFPGRTLEVPAAALSPTGGTGNITGTVKNAVTGSVVSGVAVKAYKGINAGPSPKHNAAADFTVTSDVNGVFTITGASSGNYTLVYGSTGYSETFGSANAVNGVTKNVGNVLVAPTAAASGIYVVLTWGSASSCATPANNIPCDLDAHLTGPLVTDTAQRFQVFSGNLRYIVAPDTIAALDLGASNGNGPEILSIRPSAPIGTYKFYVHNATLGTGANKALADSASARVDVYQDGHLLGTFFPPAGATGNVWNVFNYDGARILPVGTITTEATPAVLSSPSQLRVPSTSTAAPISVRPLRPRPD